MYVIPTQMEADYSPTAASLTSIAPYSDSVLGPSFPAFAPHKPYVFTLIPRPQIDTV